MTKNPYTVRKTATGYHISGPRIILSEKNKERAELLCSNLNDAFMSGREAMQYDLLNLLGASPDDHSHD